MTEGIMSNLNNKSSAATYGVVVVLVLIVLVTIGGSATGDVDSAEESAPKTINLMNP
jgi:hypothetical protein